jgi:hypothetical protein
MIIFEVTGALEKWNRMGLQLFYTRVKFGSAGVLGSAVALSLVRELGPVLTAIIVTAHPPRLGYLLFHSSFSYMRDAI